MAERASLENWRPRKGSASSNLAPSAIVFRVIRGIGAGTVASALMIRRTVEELCNDRAAIGNNLKDRLVALGNKVVLPTDLMDALNNVRLLGNDSIPPLGSCTYLVSLLQYASL